MAQIQRVRVALSGDSAAGGGLSTYYFPGTVLTPTARAIAAQFWGNIDAQLSASLSWEVEQEVARIEDTTGLIISIDSDATAYQGAGAIVGERLPPANQLMVHWFTGVVVAGRRLRGRTFIPGIPSVNSVDGAPTTNLVNLVAQEANLMIANGPNKVFSPTHLTSHNVTSVAVETSEFAVLRSRRD